MRKAVVVYVAVSFPKGGPPALRILGSSRGPEFQKCFERGENLFGSGVVNKTVNASWSKRNHPVSIEGKDSST